MCCSSGAGHWSPYHSTRRDCGRPARRSAWCEARAGSVPPVPPRSQCPQMGACWSTRPRRASRGWRRCDRPGREVAQVGERARYGGLRLAPDGKRAAVEIWNSEKEGRDLFLLDLASGVITRLTSDPVDAFAPAWSPDGRRLAYPKPSPGPPDLAVMSIDSAGPPRILLTDAGVQVARALVSRWPTPRLRQSCPEELQTRRVSEKCGCSP